MARLLPAIPPPLTPLSSLHRLIRRCAAGPSIVKVKRHGMPKLHGWVAAIGVDKHDNAITHTDTGCIRVVVARIQDISQALIVLRSDGFHHAALRCTGRLPFTAGDIFQPSMLTDEMRGLCKEAEVICDDGKTFKNWVYKPYLIQALACMPAPSPHVAGPVVAYIPSILCPAHKFTVISLY